MCRWVARDLGLGGGVLRLRDRHWKRLGRRHRLRNGQGFVLGGLRHRFGVAIILVARFFGHRLGFDYGHGRLGLRPLGRRRNRHGSGLLSRIHRKRRRLLSRIGGNRRRLLRRIDGNRCRLLGGIGGRSERCMGCDWNFQHVRG